MRKLLSGLGVVFLALLVFVGMIHFLLVIQGNGTPEVMRSLNGMPVIGGFFMAPPESVEEDDEVDVEERRARIRLEQSRKFFPPPEGVSADELGDLRQELLSERQTYADRLEELRGREEAVERAELEMGAEREALQQMLDQLDTESRTLSARREELERTQVRMNEDERRNLGGIVNAISSMTPDNAAAVLNGMEVSSAAKIMRDIESRRASKILDAIAAGGPQDGGGRNRVVELVRAMGSITSEPAAADNGG